MTDLLRPSKRSFPDKIQTRLKDAVRQANYGSRYYEMKLKGKHPLKLLGTPKDPWKGSVAAGAHVLARRFSFAGQVLRHPVRENGAWDIEELWKTTEEGHPLISHNWLDFLHSFGWLRDLNRSVDRRSARRRAEELVAGWLDQHNSWNIISWQPDIIGRRLVNWLAYAPLIMDTDDLVYRSKVLNSIARQTRHLMNTLDDVAQGPKRLLVLSGLIHAGLFVPNNENWLDKGLRQLKKALAQEILDDGGVRSRSPHDQYRLLRDLLMLKSAMVNMGHPCPDDLEAAIARMVPFLQAMLHGDGKLALFNGSFEQQEEDILATLQMAGLAVPAQLDCEQTGYRRIENGKSVIIFDSGPPPLTEFSEQGHAGTLSFEMSRGKNRIFVNCGSGAFFPTQDEVDLAAISRLTATHSTLVVNDRNSTKITDECLLGRGPEKVFSQRLAEDGHVLLEACHDGYQRRFGALHRRLLYLNEDGTDLRGEDRLEPAKASSKSDAKGLQQFDIRFHLHPDLTISVQQEQINVRLPDNEIWVFRCGGAGINMHLENSLYLGSEGRLQHTRQIVLSGQYDKDETKEATVVKWSFKREKTGA